MANPFESLATLLFRPRVYFSQLHRFEEGFLWAAFVAALGLTMSMDGGDDSRNVPPVFLVSTLAAIIVVLPVTFHIVARIFGGEGDFEPTYAGVAGALLATCAPAVAVVYMAQAPENLPFGGYEVLPVFLVLCPWLLFLLWNCLTVLHALPWWRALLALFVFLISCVPVYGNIVWLFMAPVFVFGLLVSFRGSE